MAVAVARQGDAAQAGDVRRRAVDGDAEWVNVLRMVGQTPVALLVTVIYAMLLLGRGRRSR